MLVLSRRLGEEIVIDSTITVAVLGIQGSRVRLGIRADPDVRILRSELTGAKSAGRKPAANGKGHQRSDSHPAVQPV